MGSLLIAGYRLQPEPQPLPSAQQSALQQQHEQSLQTHAPLSQQPQQSQASQPALPAVVDRRSSRHRQAPLF
jgi:hypothetical protein